MTHVLNDHSDTGSFLYRDLPFVEIPYFWSFSSSFFYGKRHKEKRLHGDDIMIHPDAPDAFDEMIWKSHLEEYENDGFSRILPRDYSNTDLEKHFASNLKKILHVRGEKTRYLGKGNYHLLRVKYIQKLFPDARFILCTRNPFQHAMSLTRVHQKFVELGAADPKFTQQMEMLGHYEFGNGRKAIKCGKNYSKTMAHWKVGEEYKGYLLQWYDVYQFASQYYSQDKNILWLDHDQFIQNPKKKLSELMEFTGLDPKKIDLEQTVTQIKTQTPKSTPSTEYDQIVKDLYEEIQHRL